MSSLRPSSFLPALLAAITLAGCSAGGVELARVGNKVITAAEFQDIARGNEIQYPGTDAIAKQALITDLVRREVLLAVARQRGDDTTAIARRFRENLENEIARQALVDAVSPQSAGVSDGEIAALWRDRQQVVDVSLIFTPDRGLLRQATTYLASGMPFADVAKRVNSPGMLPPEGALGPTLSGQLIPPLDKEMLRLPVGGVGGPYSTPQGWFLLKVNSRRPQEQSPLAAQQTPLGEAIRQRKQRQELTQRMADLRDAYHVRLEPGGGQELFELLSPARMGERVDLAGADRTRVIARWKGGEYTLGNAIDDMNSDRQRPPYGVLPALEGWIENMVMQRVTVAEAKRRHLLEDPRARREHKARWEQFLMEGVYSSVVADVPPPGLEQVRAFYDGSRQQFARLQSARVYRLVTSDSALAFRVTRHGGHSGTLVQATAMADPSAKVEELTIAFPSADPDWSMLEQALLRMPNGEWEGPVPTPAGWRILQLVDKTTMVPTFEQLDPGLQQRIVSTVIEVERDRRLAQFTDSLRTSMGVRVNARNLDRQPWPAPGILDVGH